MGLFCVFLDLKPEPAPPPQVGGMVLHEGQVAEMATGEGKTLVATLPTYLNAIRHSGSGRQALSPPCFTLGSPLRFSFCFPGSCFPARAP